MKNNPEDVLKSIPDFEELMKLSAEISALLYKKLVLDTEIKEWESLVFKRATTEEQFFHGGKPPSSTYIDNTYKFPGLAGEILPLRKELAAAISDLEGKRLQMDVYKNMIEIWRTLSSNQRSTSL